MVYLGPSQFISVYLRISLFILGYLRLCLAILGYLSQSLAVLPISGYPWQCLFISAISGYKGYLVPSLSISSYLGLILSSIKYRGSSRSGRGQVMAIVNFSVIFFWLFLTRVIEELALLIRGAGRIHLVALHLTIAIRNGFRVLCFNV